MLCSFLSILVHELGHVLMGRFFGSYGQIVLYSFGGLALGSSDVPRRSQRILVYLAGPAAGFALYGLVRLGVLFLRQQELSSWDPRLLGLLLTGIGMLLFMNLIWNILNLLPIWPLDGGQVSREVCQQLQPGRGIRLSLAISFLLAAVLAVNALITSRGGRPLLPFVPFTGMYAAILFALLAVDSFLLWQQPSPPWSVDKGERY